MTTAFELQIYKNGQWQFDSYFDDRDTVVSEAERMNRTGRYAGVRVLQETYKENSNACQYHVIFSRLGKDGSAGANDWRDRYQGPPPASGADEDERSLRRHRDRPRPQKKRKKSNPVALVAVATVLVLAGIAAVIGLRSVAGVG